MVHFLLFVLFEVGEMFLKLLGNLVGPLKVGFKLFQMLGKLNLQGYSRLFAGNSLSRCSACLSWGCWLLVVRHGSFVGAALRVALNCSHFAADNELWS
jgi:hypothetical protein